MQVLEIIKRLSYGHRKPPLTPPLGENHWPARLIINGFLWIMKTTSQIIRQSGTIFWDGCKGLLYREFETTTMLLGGRGLRKPPLTPPRGENHWPARQIINGLLWIMKNTSQIIRQLGILFWDGCKGLLYREFETTLTTLGGRGIGPGEGAGASFERGISWPRVFVSFCSQKERKDYLKRSVNCLLNDLSLDKFGFKPGMDACLERGRAGSDVPFVNFSSEKVRHQKTNK